ncbi:transcriptional regulator [Calothrix sp. FACHB-156]|nr:transcriptional regulator [Nostoc linckia FACHB-104]MBD2338607.1 transcriptional regulator [Calothrix sp. FACHB-156]
MSQPIISSSSIDNIDVPLERDIFLRTLIRELSGTLQDIVGMEEASGFISVVGQTIGKEIDHTYKSALQVSNLDREQVIQVLLDLKKRIQGDFFVLEETPDKIVFGNRICPFAEKVLGRQSMCMMTSNVFGSIAADNLGYSKVELQKTIANGDAQCQVVVYLQPTELAGGREYFKG